MTTNREKPILFLGMERSWQCVFEYYEMIRDAYNDYIDKHCETMTEQRRLYVISFKERIDGIGKMLGLEPSVQLPTNINKIKSKPQEKENNEE